MQGVQSMGAGYNLFWVALVCMFLAVVAAVMCREAYRDIVHNDVDRSMGDASSHIMSRLYAVTSSWGDYVSNLVPSMLYGTQAPKQGAGGAAAAAGDVSVPNPVGPTGSKCAQGGVAAPNGGAALPYGGAAQPYGGAAQPYGGAAQPYGGAAQPYGAAVPYSAATPPGSSKEAYPDSSPFDDASAVTIPGAASNGFEESPFGPGGPRVI